MDKKFVMGIAAMAALTLVSCSSDDLDSFSDNSSKNEAISFDGYLGRSAVAVNGTRGSVVDVTALQSAGFGVFGNYSKDATTAYGNNLFDNQQVTYYKSATSAKWTYSPLKFWPSDGHIDFLAYAPYDKDTKLTDGSKIKDFTVSKTITDQKDLLWTKAKSQITPDVTSTKEKVKFQFHHALSRLGYTVNLSGDYTYDNVKFILNEITLAGSAPNATKSANAFYTEGTIDLSTGHWEKHSEDAGKQNFNNWFFGDKLVTYVNPTDKTKKTVSNPSTDYLFVIPQNFSEKIEEAGQQKDNPDKLYVIVKYTIDYGAGVKQENKVYKQIIPNFVQGKAYTLNLTIGLPIEFDVDVTNGVDDWGPEDGINIGSNDNPWER